MNTISVPATLDSLALISEFVLDAAASAGMDDHAAWQVQLAVDEAATNVIQHGYEGATAGQIEVGWAVEQGSLVVSLHDHGRRFRPEDIPEPDIHSPLDERQAGGLGLFLMNKLMDAVHFNFDSVKGNTLVMRKSIQPPEAAVSVFALTGRLDAVSTNQSLEQPRAAIAAGARQILLDLSGVTFLSSSGLRALLLLRKELLAHDGQLRLCSLQAPVQEVFSLTGFTQVFAIHPSRDDALAAFRQG